MGHLYQCATAICNVCFVQSNSKLSIQTGAFIWRWPIGRGGSKSLHSWQTFHLSLLHCFAVMSKHWTLRDDEDENIVIYEALIRSGSYGEVHQVIASDISLLTYCKDAEYRYKQGILPRL